MEPRDTEPAYQTPPQAEQLPPPQLAPAVTPDPRPSRAGGRGLAGLLGVSLLSAALASGGTAAILAANLHAAPIAASPAQSANATTVNQTTVTSDDITAIVA